MACNTIHLFKNRLIQQSGYENISDITKIVSKALEQTPGKICTLATPATVTSGLYQVTGREYSDPNPVELVEIGEVVMNYNATGEIEKNRATLLRIIDVHKIDGATVFIAGCTEVSELLRNQNIALLDTLELLIEDTVSRILNS